MTSGPDRERPTSTAPGRNGVWGWESVEGGNLLRWAQPVPIRVSGDVTARQRRQLPECSGSQGVVVEVWKWSNRKDACEGTIGMLIPAKEATRFNHRRGPRCQRVLPDLNRSRSGQPIARPSRYRVSRIGGPAGLSEPPDRGPRIPGSAGMTVRTGPIVSAVGTIRSSLHHSCDAAA